MSTNCTPLRRPRRPVPIAAFVALVLMVANLRGAEPIAPIESVIRIGMTVSDMDRSVAFFRDVLNFTKVDETEVAGKTYEQITGVFGLRARVAVLALGVERLELTEYLTSGGRPLPPDSHSNDRWFQHIAIVTTDMDKAYARLRAHHVRHASTGPQRLPDWNVNAAGIRAFYFHDPDGHVLEVIWFPRGKGDPRWQSATDLFAGIDHTAIVVANTDKALSFYRDALGMRIVGSGENYGDEQEHLNNVQGAHLRLTTLKAPLGGPGIELLEYQAPTTGRPYPPDARADDLVHWHTTLRTADPPAALDRLRRSHFATISPAVGDGTPRAVRVADPDGHVVELIEP
ncbi:MAG: glyoxalase [Planctomycetes bacterium]|nr:glyoxalase [Planctomycetota bacterium]